VALSRLNHVRFRLLSRSPGAPNPQG
jgi:hypothetical protein